MHHYGGGYTDIKRTSRDWTVLFDALEASDAHGLGYPEIVVANIGHPLEQELQRNMDKLIGTGAFIFKRRTPFTQDWIADVHKFLDGCLPFFQRSATYPVGYDAMMGDVLHPLLYRKYLDGSILRYSEIMPSFSDYR
jgi:hypothetical protein